MLKIVLLALVFSVLTVYLKSINSELFTLSLIGSGIIILYSGLAYLTETLKFFNTLTEISGIDGEYMRIIFKITAVGFLTEFGAETVEDFGLKSLSDKLVFVGKLLILTISLPVFYAVINIISGLQ